MLRGIAGLFLQSLESFMKNNVKWQLLQIWAIVAAYEGELQSYQFTLKMAKATNNTKSPLIFLSKNYQ